VTYGSSLYGYTEYGTPAEPADPADNLSTRVPNALYQAMGPLRAGDEANGWPLRTFCDVVSAPISEVAALADETDTQIGWGLLFNPTTCPLKALPWLGQLVGADIPTGTPPADARTIIRDLPGWKRGTPAAIVAATKLYLSGSGVVSIIERPGGDPYAVTVAVVGSQITDLAGLTAAVKATIPAGLKLTIEAQAGWHIADFEARHALDDITAFEAAWVGRTVHDFESELP
jgi:hypothetical protein